MDEMPGMIRPDLQALFPACAGVILCSGSTRHRCATFPRLCGGDPNMKYYRVEVSAFSPPVRG